MSSGLSSKGAFALIIIYAPVLGMPPVVNAQETAIEPHRAPARFCALRRTETEERSGRRSMTCCCAVCAG